MKSTSEITASAIYKVTTKATGKVCYAVPSDTQEGVYYITCFDDHTASWTCTCPAGKYGRTCKHAKAAQVSILANKAREDERKAQEAEAMFRSLATSDASKMSDEQANDYFLSLAKAEDERKAQALLDSCLDDEPVIQHSELGSCDTCGYQVKPGVTTCARCLGY